jgi:hypothetical protein
MFEPIFELQDGPALGLDAWESNYKLRFTPDLKPEAYIAGSPL